MRFILVPLSMKETMVYCQRTNLLPLASTKPRLDDRLAQRATKTWNTWTKSEKNWQRKIVSWANSAMEKISYEEWSLKTIPAKNAFLRRTSEKKEHVSIEEVEKHQIDTEDIVVEYPAKMLTTSQVTERLRSLAEKGKSHHNKFFWLSAIGAPLTLPVAALPVIPNLPGFYLLFRAWSHWKALEGAKHLSFLVNGDHLRFQDNMRLNQLCDTDKSEKGKEDFILTDQEIDQLSEDLEAAEMAPELHRAIKQVKKKANDQ